ncbi:UvrD-helicase domain-containing protein [Engelhardtia mirabilis]|uniref:DNA 3'-5' helicase n=1 Tax=Engelhardtia mirabilis TaxID=2528011 RepID=A0A518BP15_9BACT|nr:ATP-dependent helicase/nuclease subunit A [Planctomycetes bacterium Pla133]QDV03047.1 ATP-dependent helicase/nuclease subunit A [Planctomycetes bacterium Pla86]
MKLDRDSLRAADAAARVHATTQFDSPIVLQAGAGTGKTATLVARIVAWVTGPGWDCARELLGEVADAGQLARRTLSGVVAITFTEAAASEMSERVGGALAQLAAGERLPIGLHREALIAGDDELRARAAALRGAMEQLAVSTIHAFCGRLIAAHPFELGRHPEVAVDAEGDALEAVSREVVEDELARAYGDPGDEAWLRLAREGHGPAEIAETLFELLQAGARPHHFELDPLGERPVRALAERASAALRALHELLGPKVGDLGRAKKTIELAQALSAALGHFDQGPLELAAVLHCVDAELLEGSFDAKLTEFAKGSLGKAETDALGDDSAELAAAARDVQALLRHLRKLDPELLDAGRAVIAPLLTDARERLRRRGVASFDDLLADAADLLRNDAAALERERRRIDQLLVDEFQDTDERQCDIVRWLALRGPRADRPGLFVVGDPKQSIYGWRRADLAAFERFVADVEAEGGSVEQLVVNYRSSEAVLDEVGRAMEWVMLPEPGIQAHYEPLVVPASGADPKTAPPEGEPALEYRLYGELDTEGSAAKLGKLSRTLATRRDAEAVAEDIAGLHAAGRIAWGDCAILMRSTGDLDQYLDALKRRGVPYSVARDKSYYRRREVIDAAALLRAIADPGDLLALVTWLRSPAVGVPDGALLPLWRAGLPAHAVALDRPGGAALAGLEAAVERARAELPAGLPGLEHIDGWHHAAIDGLRALGELRQSLRTDPAELFVDRLRRRTLVEGTEAARFLGAYRVANLERFFARLVTALEDAAGDQTRVARALRRAVAESRESEEGRPREAGEDAVQVMTIHRSKGLEFRCVYLAQLHKESAGNRLPPVELEGYHAPSGEEHTAYVLFGAPSLDRDLLVARRERTEAAERVRTLYVAMTRASARLVCGSGWVDERFAGGNGPQFAKSHAELLDAREGVPTDLGALLAQLAGEDPAEAFVDDAHGARFRLVAPDDGATAAGREEVRPTDLARAARDVATLVAARAAARERAARPLVAPASADAHHLLERAFAESRLSSEDNRTAAPADATSLGSQAAMWIGSAVHGALEALDLEADLGPQLDAAEAQALEQLAVTFSGETRDAGLDRARALFEALRTGPLPTRLVELREGLLARELPVLLPPAPEEFAPTDPLGAWSGAIDLVYRDPGTDEVVVVDFKTDAVESKAARVERETVYAPQLARYARAVQEALDLPRRPRCELWWIATGEISTVLDPIG